MATRDRVAALLVGGLLLGLAGPAGAQQKPAAAAIPWQAGPCDGLLGTVAVIKVPAGYHFTGAAGAKAQMERMGNSPDTKLLGLLEPVADDQSWLVTFSYDAVGYVKDDEKDKIDAGGLLQNYRDGTAEDNKRRAKMGAPPMNVVGWETPPFYNTATNRLSWAIRGECQGEQIVNYNSRLLGRAGCMSANLIADPEDLAKTLPVYDKLLAGYTFNAGQQYAEFRPGDRVAEFGLGP